MDTRLRSSGWRTSPAWQAYAWAFDTFRHNAAVVQSLSATPQANREVIDAAVLAMEAAREDYRKRRDTLVSGLTSAQILGFHHEGLPTEDEVREVASLLWELEGKPDGRALDDWYWAEDILRRAASTVTAGAGSR